MTRERLLNEMSSAELTEWMIYYSIEPWGLYVDDSLNALNTSIAYNTQVKHGKTMQEFLLFPPPQRPLSVEESIEMTKAAMGAVPKTKHKKRKRKR